jgi:hypothetical protein
MRRADERDISRRRCRVALPAYVLSATGLRVAVTITGPSVAACKARREEQRGRGRTSVAWQVSETSGSL